MVYSGKKAKESVVAPVKPRIGVFICHCGTNIAGSLDVVVAACTLHEPTLRTATANDGLNPVPFRDDQTSVTRALAMSIMQNMGLEHKRFRMTFVSASDGAKWAVVINDVINHRKRDRTKPRCSRKKGKRSVTSSVIILT